MFADFLVHVRATRWQRDMYMRSKELLNTRDDLLVLSVDFAENLSAKRDQQLHAEYAVTQQFSILPIVLSYRSPETGKVITEHHFFMRYVHTVLSMHVPS